MTRKVWLILLGLVLVFGLVMLGCGGNKDEEEQGGLPSELGDHEIVPLGVPSGESATKATTGENNSKLHKVVGGDLAKINGATPGSFIGVSYKSDVGYACGEIGWIDGSNAGPVVHGEGASTTKEVFIPVEELIKTEDDFTVHIFNGATLVDIVLYVAPEDYVITPNPKATTGGKKIVIPFGSKLAGNGDLSKADFKTITTAESGSLVFYFDDEADTSSGILKFGPKRGDPYKHFGIDSDGTNKDESGKGWRVIDGETKTIKYTVAEIKAAVTAAGTTFNKFEINMGDTKKADLLYIELILE
jgi:hypothetical protein